MFQPRLRKVLLKRALDGTLYRGVARGAAAVVVASQREGDDVVRCGVPVEKACVRGNGFPEPVEVADGDLRERLGIPADAPLVLYVGRIAAGKGLGHPFAGGRGRPGGAGLLPRPGEPRGVSA